VLADTANSTHARRGSDSITFYTVLDLECPRSGSLIRLEAANQAPGDFEIQLVKSLDSLVGDLWRFGDMKSALRRWGLLNGGRLCALQIQRCPFPIDEHRAGVDQLLAGAVVGFVTAQSGKRKEEFDS
jgi:hypothetical protein